jgi:hypothetical protein
MRRRGERAGCCTYQQCAAILVKKELGVQPSAATRATYREILDLDADASSASLAPPAATYALVGRDAEWRALVRAWRAAEAGRPQLLLVRGEATSARRVWSRSSSTGAARRTSTRRRRGAIRAKAGCISAPVAAWLQSAALSATLNA